MLNRECHFDRLFIIKMQKLLKTDIKFNKLLIYICFNIVNFSILIVK